MSIKHIMLMTLVLGLLSNEAICQVEKHLANYMCNFISYLEWPSEYRKSEFRIGVLGGGDPVVKELVAATMSKKVGSRDIVVVPFNSVDEITTCHILFIPSRSSQFAPEAYEKIKSTSTLLITASTTGIESGAAINFIVVDGKLNFEIKPANATARKIKLSSSLTNLAEKVIA